jgi:hypothetical protein
MRYVVAIVVAVLLTVSRAASAQPIHGHSQLAAYSSRAQWPTDSAQCHWMPADAVVPPAAAMIGHTHVDMKFPRYAEVDGPMTINFTLKLFHVSGSITGIYAGVFKGPSARDVVWDDTGTADPPLMIGDPHGLKIWTGHLTFDTDPTIPHGWYAVVLSAITSFDFPF